MKKHIGLDAANIRSIQNIPDMLHWVFIMKFFQPTVTTHFRCDDEKQQQQIISTKETTTTAKKRPTYERKDDHFG